MVLRRAVLRVLEALGVVAVVAVAIFVLGWAAPGDPVVRLAAQPGIGAGEIEALRAELGLGQGALAQVGGWLAGLARGEMGQSLITGVPVAEEVARRLPASLELALAGLCVALLLALPLAVVAALRPGGLLDRGVRALAAGLGAVPTFLSGIVLIEVFYARLGLAPEPVGRLAQTGPAAPPPRSGMLTLDAVLAGEPAVLAAALAQLALPALCMGLFAFGPILRIARAALAAALASPQIEAARMLGLPEGWVLTRLGLQAAAGPVIAVAGLALCYLLGAAAMVERVFAWPGIGLYALQAALAQDPAPVLGALCAIAVVVVAVQLVAEALQRLADPRLSDAA